MSLQTREITKSQGFDKRVCEALFDHAHYKFMSENRWQLNELKIHHGETRIFGRTTTPVPGIFLWSYSLFQTFVKFFHKIFSDYFSNRLIRLSSNINLKVFFLKIPGYFSDTFLDKTFFEHIFFVVFCSKKATVIYSYRWIWLRSFFYLHSIFWTW